ncbi:MAG: transglycosylase SLT domain-containing protein [Sphingomicrobium sp.]
MRRSTQILSHGLLILTALQSCSPGRHGSASGEQNETGRASSDGSVPPPAYELALPDYLRTKLSQPFTGDLDAMVERRIIRVAAPFSRTFYYIANGVQRGLSYEYMKLYEDQLNAALPKDHPWVFVVVLPIARDRLLPELVAGKVDMVAAQLTVTPDRSRVVDFTTPTRTEVNEVQVSGPGTSPLASAAELSGKTVFVRKSSSYFQSLQRLNQALRKSGKAPVDIQPAPENLEDDDLLEMVNAKLIPATVVDNYLALFWKNLFPNLVLSEQAPVHAGGNLAVAIRKSSPKLAASLNGFIHQYGLKSATGAVLNKRYLQNPDYVKDANSKAERAKFLATVNLFRQYGQKYDFDYLLMAAQGYQESRLDQNARSGVGAIGVMQLMPKTGEELAVGDVHQLPPNIHAGVKYMSFLRDRYFANEPMDRLNTELFTFASYNAGPGKVRQLRREAASRGLNPNVWFGSVEQVAAERSGPETVTYVSNIFKYYIAYKLIVEEKKRRDASKQTIAQNSARTR